MRLLAIDLGDKRTGVAVGDDGTGIVTPLTVVAIPRGDRLLDAIAVSIAEHDPDAIVIGLPVHMDGTEGDRAKISRDFGAALATRCSLPIHYQDERLTSSAAERHLDGSGRTHKQKKAIRDALAAAEILQDYLAGGDARTTTTPHDG